MISLGIEVDWTAPWLHAGVLVVFALVLKLVSLATKAPSKHEDMEILKSLKVPDDTLFPIFQPHLVAFDALKKEGYSSALALQHNLLGVQPNSNTVMAIWPPAFEAYSLIVPNFLNMPDFLLGLSAPREYVSLAMYASSRANKCAYCTSHCCTFSVRRGVDPSILRNLLDEMTRQRQSDGTGSMTGSQRSVVKVAYGLGTVPVSLTNQDVKEIYKFLPGPQVEWIVAAAAMMGFLNKAMDGLGIPVEADVFAETVDIMDKEYSVLKAGASVSSQDVKRHTPPPRDGWWIILSSLYHGLRPGGAMHLDKKLLQGIPTDAAECIIFLQKHTGSKFQIVEKLQHDKLRRATVALVCRLFQDRVEGLGTKIKALAGLQFCDILENERLKEELVKHGKWAGIGFQDGKPRLPTDGRSQLILKVAKALSYNPSRMSSKIVNELKAVPSITASNLVELVSFLAVVQMLHRITAFQEIKSLADVDI